MPFHTPRLLILFRFSPFCVPPFPPCPIDSSERFVSVHFTHETHFRPHSTHAQAYTEHTYTNQFSYYDSEKSIQRLNAMFQHILLPRLDIPSILFGIQLFHSSLELICLYILCQFLVPGIINLSEQHHSSFAFTN